LGIGDIGSMGAGVHWFGSGQVWRRKAWCTGVPGNASGAGPAHPHWGDSRWRRRQSRLRSCSRCIPASPGPRHSRPHGPDDGGIRLPCWERRASFGRWPAASWAAVAVHGAAAMTGTLLDLVRLIAES